jgi:hypothetical protein
VTYFPQIQPPHQTTIVFQGGFAPRSLLVPGTKFHLQSRASNKNLRIRPDGTVDGSGAQGPKATFILQAGKKHPQSFRFQNAGDNKHWLRITNVNKVDGLGTGGNYTEFRVVEYGGGWVSLISCETGFYVGITSNGNVKQRLSKTCSDDERFLLVTEDGFVPV